MTEPRRRWPLGSDQNEDFLAATLPALDLVYNLARRSAKDRFLVEDIIQETYLRAYEAWAGGRRPRNVEPWLATICLNVGRSLWRRAATRREVLKGEPAEAGSDTDVEEEAIRGIRRELIHAALWMLPEEQRLTITLMDLNGFPASEVAKIMGVPRGTVLSRAHRGRKKLAALLEGVVPNVEA